MDNAKSDKIASFIAFYEGKIPFHNFLGLKVVELKKGYVKIRCPYKPELIGDIRSNNWHGGVIATVLDAAGGMAAASLLKSKADKLATLDIRIDYLKPVQSEKGIIVTGEVIRAGGNSIVTNLQAFDETTEALAADGRAVFSVKRASET